MSKALIVFGSTTGNTEAVAEVIADVMSNEGVDVTLKNVTDTSISDLGNGYDVTVLGASTWGDDEIEFQEDFEPFFEKMDDADLKGKKAAVFGCGDSSYEYFCGAVDELESKVEDLGASNVVIGLRIDGDPDDSLSDVQSWAKEIAAAI